MIISIPPNQKQDTRKGEVEMFIFEWGFGKNTRHQNEIGPGITSQNPANESNSTICNIQDCIAP